MQQSGTSGRVRAPENFIVGIGQAIECVVLESSAGTNDPERNELYMNACGWDREEWVARSVEALEPLEKTVTGQRYGVAPVANEDYRRLGELATHDEHAKAYFDHLFPSLNGDPDPLIDLLCRHPGIRPNLGGGDKRDTFIVMPSSGHLLQMDTLARYLTRTALKHGCGDAVVRLERLLSLSAEGKVPGYEVYVFRGLSLSGEIEIVPGLEIVDYARAAQRGLVKDYSPKSTEDGRENADIGALVLARAMTWGPCLVPPLSGRDEFPAPARDFRWAPGCDTGIFFDLLSLCTSRQVQALSIMHCAPEFVDVNEGFGPGTGRSFSYSERLRGEALGAQEIERLREVLGLWSEFNPEKRDVLELAASRVSSSVYRDRGRFRVQDRILDAAIALEIMYELNPPELTNKLASRAAHLLAQEIDDRIEIFDRVHAFYEARSRIAHGGKGKKKKKAVDFEDAAESGFGLAADTFSALLNRGEFPDWKRTILSP